MQPALHLLLIEDNPADALHIETLLMGCVTQRFAATPVARLTEAIELVAARRFDLILLDLHLPDANGLESVARVCQAAPAIPVVVLTDREDRELAIGAIQAGAQDYVCKGKLSADVLERVCRYSRERHRHRLQLKESERFLRATLDTLSAHIAILDNEGCILAVNKAWSDFGRRNHGVPATAGAGARYLDICAAATGEDAATAARAAAGIRAVIEGESETFEMEYPCHGPEEQRWFHLRVTPFAEPGQRRVVVAHENITSRKDAEEGRSRSEGLFEKLFEMVPLGLWLADSKGRLLRGNPEGYRIWGLEPGTTLRQGMFKARRFPSPELIAPADWAIVRSVRERQTIRDELLEVEAADGEQRYILNFTAPLENDQGQIEGGVAANLDVTTRRKAEAAATMSENRIRLIFDTSPNCLFIKDAAGRYVLANRSTANLFDTTAGHLLGKSDDELGPGAWGGTIEHDGAPFAPEEADAQARHMGVQSFTLADGTQLWFRLFKAPITWREHHDCELTIAVNITEARQIREDLRRSEQLLRTTLDSLNSQVVVLDRNLRIVWENRTAREQAHEGAPPSLEKHCYEPFDLLPKACPDCPSMQALTSGAPAHRIKTSSTGRTVSLFARPILDDAGAVLNVVVVADDITERLSLERQLRQAQKMESLGTLAGGIAHDFNNILSGILGYADLARMKTRELPVIQDYLQEVASAGMRATELVRQILTFSRRQDADLQPLQVPLVVKEALKLLRSTLPTTVALKTSIDNRVDPVLADPTQIHQIIMNLCVNASHAMEPGGGELTVTVDQVTPPPSFFAEHPDLLPGPHLRLQVGDTGCGMTPEILASIFDPYFTTKNLGEGTGLGLAVVHGIVKQYAGDIMVDSIPGQGSTFTLYLPVVAQKMAEPETTATELPVGHGEHILLVDDEPVLGKFYLQFLQQQGYRVTVHNDPLDALTVFEHEPAAFDLVLTDVTMPGMTGDRMGLRMMAIRPGLPVLLMTGYTRLLTEEQAKQQGFQGLLTKPLLHSELLRQLRKILTEEQEPAHEPRPR